MLEPDLAPFPTAVQIGRCGEPRTRIALLLESTAPRQTPERGN